MKKLVVLVLLAASLTACGSSPTSADADTYADCLRKEGVELPSGAARPSGQARPSGEPRPTADARPSGQPRPGGSARPGGAGGFGDQAPAGVDPTKWQAALAKCGSLRPSGFAGQSPGGFGQRPGADTAYQNCLGEHKDVTADEAAKLCAVLSPAPRPS